MVARGRRLRWRITGGIIAVLVILAAGGPFAYIHYIQTPAPEKLAPPRACRRQRRAVRRRGHARRNLAGGLGAGYRVREVLIGQSSTFARRTPQVRGSIMIAGTSVRAAPSPWTSQPCGQPEPTPRRR
jgi:hypothetical protein